MNTYGTLKATIADWLDREDLTGQIPTFIRLAEGDIYDGLRCHDNEFTMVADKVSYTLAGNPPLVTTDELITNLPSNYREMRLVTWNDRPLEHISQQHMQRNVWRVDSNTVRSFAISGRQIEFFAPLGPVADWEDTTKLVYRFYGTESLDGMPTYQTSQNPVESPVIEDNAPDGLVQTDSNTTRLLQQHPQMYLQGALRHAYLYLVQPQKAAEAEMEFLKAKARVEKSATELLGSTTSIRNAYTDSLRSY
jgi:hypothetical protein